MCCPPPHCTGLHSTTMFLCNRFDFDTSLPTPDLRVPSKKLRGGRSHKFPRATRLPRPPLPPPPTHAPPPQPVTISARPRSDAARGARRPPPRRSCSGTCPPTSFTRRCCSGWAPRTSPRSRGRGAGARRRWRRPRSCSGPNARGRQQPPGTSNGCVCRVLVYMPHIVGTERCWSGCTTPAARGIRRHVGWPLGAGTSRCCSGRGSTAACGTHRRVRTQLGPGTILRVLQWAREHNCPWNSNTCSCAAEGGHL